MRSFNNLASIEKIVFAVINHLNDNWRKTLVYEINRNVSTITIESLQALPLRRQQLLLIGA
jgi:hypothetical protein